VLAEKFDMKVYVENEGVCNIAGLGELEAVMTTYRHPRLRALPDIANAYRTSRPPSAADLARLLPFTDILNIKDYINAARRFVAVDEGDIPIATLLAATLPTREVPPDAYNRNACLLGARRHHATISKRAAPHGRLYQACLTLPAFAEMAHRVESRDFCGVCC
jgi:hypothetical protein